MFTYTDPAGNLLKKLKALDAYRRLIHEQYRTSARVPDSACTLLEAFDGLQAANIQEATVTWLAFPRLSTSAPQQIDQNRFEDQEEYVEWRTEKKSGKVSRVTFTTEFTEYWEALAQTSAAAVIEVIKSINPAARPNAAELFGAGLNPTTASAEARGRQFRNFATRNPWNNGTKDILFLTHPVNSARALFGLLEQCAIPKANLHPGAVCASVGGACVPGRNSDPSVCSAVQAVAREKKSLTLKDPVGINLLSLEGIWKVNNKQIDVNDPAANKGVWTLSRGNRRGVLKVIAGLTVDDEPITSGFQVSTHLKVGATVIAASEAVLPEWSRMGKESSRQLVAAGGI